MVANITVNFIFMKKYFLVLGIFILLISMKPEESKTDQIINDIDWFIDTVKAHSYGGDQFIVYVLYIYKNDSVENDYCCVMSYIVNSNSYNKTVRPYYYIEKGNDVIVVALGDGLKKEHLSGLNLIDLKLEKKIKIAQKLFPASVGESVGTFYKMKCCYSADKHYRKFYNDRNYTPSGASLFQNSRD